MDDDNNDDDDKYTQSPSLQCLLVILENRTNIMMRYIYTMESTKDGATLLTSCLLHGFKNYTLANYILNYTYNNNKEEDYSQKNLLNEPNSKHQLPLLWLIKRVSKITNAISTTTQFIQSKNTHNNERSELIQQQPTKQSIVEGISYLIAAGATLTKVILYKLDVALFNSNGSIVPSTTATATAVSTNFHQHLKKKKGSNRWWNTLPYLEMTTFEQLSGISSSEHINIYYFNGGNDDDDNYFKCHQCVSFRYILFFFICFYCI